MFVTGWKEESSQSVREYEAGEAWTYAIDENEFYLAGEGRVIAKMNATRIQMMLSEQNRSATVFSFFLVFQFYSIPSFDWQ